MEKRSGVASGKAVMTCADLHPTRSVGRASRLVLTRSTSKTARPTITPRLERGEAPFTSRVVYWSSGSVALRLSCRKKSAVLGAGSPETAAGPWLNRKTLSNRWSRAHPRNSARLAGCRRVGAASRYFSCNSASVKSARPSGASRLASGPGQAS
jgi:hypothetical protein